MAILIDKNTRVIVQGITGREGGFHAKLMREYGTKIVAGVTPGKGGSAVDGVPVFDTVERAVRETGADTSIMFVPAPHAGDAIVEAADAGVKLVICITEGVPVHDMMIVRRALDFRGCRLIGPNCPGVITPGECKVGIMPGDVHKRGPVGVISRSGTLTYEAVFQLSGAGLGQSTCIGIGGDSVIGTSFVDCLKLFGSDPETGAVLIIGEIGGTSEQGAADFIKSGGFGKPVFAYVAGTAAPEGRRMGHAGALITGGAGTAKAKADALRAAGVTVIADPSGIGKTVREKLEPHGH